MAEVSERRLLKALHDLSGRRGRCAAVAARALSDPHNRTAVRPQQRPHSLAKGRSELPRVLCLSGQIRRPVFPIRPPHVLRVVFTVFVDQIREAVVRAL